MPRPAQYPLTSDFLSLDITRLCVVPGRSGKLTWPSGANINYRCEERGLRLMYSHGNDADRHVEDFVAFCYSPTNFGGRRRWFECRSCNRRVRKLYAGRLFRCRRCRGAVYPSQREDAISRATSQRWKIRKRLEERGCKDALSWGLDDGFPLKPPRMHWKTYRRLEAKDERLSWAWKTAAQAWLVRRDPRLRRRRRR